MGEAVGQMLPLAVGVALSPMPIVAMVLMLVTPKAKPNGLSFLAGWVLGLVVVGGLVLVITGPTDTQDEDGPATWSSGLKLVLGLLLFVVALRQWRRRPQHGEESAMPKWMGAIDGFTPAKALGAGFLLSGVNPKNLLLIVAAASAISQTGIPAGQQALVYLLFVVIATLGVATPVAIYFLMGARAGDLLDQLKSWMASHNAAIMTVLCLVIGAKLIGDAISGFSS